jgi:AraC-like DNA-binding protein
MGTNHTSNGYHQEASPNHFAGAFKAAHEVPPHQYIMTRRVERAKAMFGEKRASLVEITLACGFSLQAHLTNCFRQLTGVTPGQFRSFKWTPIDDKLQLNSVYCQLCWA